MGGEHPQETGHHHDDQGEGDEGATQTRERQGENKHLSCCFSKCPKFQKSMFVSNIHMHEYTMKGKGGYSVCIFGSKLFTPTHR